MAEQRPRHVPALLLAAATLNLPQALGITRPQRPAVIRACAHPSPPPARLQFSPAPAQPQPPLTSCCPYRRRPRHHLLPPCACQRAGWPCCSRGTIQPLPELLQLLACWRLFAPRCHCHRRRCCRRHRRSAPPLFDMLARVDHVPAPADEGLLYAYKLQLVLRTLTGVTRVLASSPRHGAACRAVLRGADWTCDRAE